MKLFTNQVNRNANQPRCFASTLLFATAAITSVATLTASVLAEPVWTETEKLLASDGQSLDGFSTDIAIDDDYALVGAPGKDVALGAAYLYDINTGVELYKFNSPSGKREYFGTSVALQNNFALIGAQQASGDFDYSGAAYLFDTQTGQELRKFAAADPTERAYFGHDVAIQGNLAIISALGADNFAGAVYIFDLTTGQQLAKLTAHDRQADDNFGDAIAADGDLLLVGAAGVSDKGLSAGAAYLFDLTNGKQISKIMPNDGQAHDLFGASVALQGNRALIGAFLDDDNDQDAGSAYLFDLDTGDQVHKLQANNVSRVAFFGIAVAFQGNTALIGASLDDALGSYVGAAYIFDLSTGNQIQKMHPSDVNDKDGRNFGSAVAIHGSHLVVGAVADSANGVRAGSAYIFALNDLAVTPDPMIAGQNATFDANSLNPNQNAYLIYSTAGLGKKYIPLLDVTIDLLKPQMAGKARKADANGQVSWNLPIPAQQRGTNVWLQVVQRQHVTSYVETTID